jgi:hypothetical protein
MASAVPDQASRPQQQWLDIARPIQPRQPGERPARRTARRRDDALAARQMELRMSAPVPSSVAPPAPATVRAAIAQRAATCDAVAAPVPPGVPIEPARPCFIAWLREQAKSGGAIGELAKAARLDPSFPKRGSADDVRGRFGRLGADGDAYAALDDAERAYDRLR